MRWFIKSSLLTFDTLFSINKIVIFRRGTRTSKFVVLELVTLHVTTSFSRFVTWVDWNKKRKEFVTFHFTTTFTRFVTWVDWKKIDDMAMKALK